MNRADIADYLGLTTEIVSHTFTHLRGSGAIQLLPGNMVELAHTDMLQNMSDGSCKIQLPYRYCCTATIALNS